jgi:hypothetical protein
MGQIRPPVSVLPLLAVTSRHDAAFAWAASQFETEFGPVQLASPQFRFDQTDYYQPSMGTDLHKQFLVPGRLHDPGELSGWKRLTNQWEEDYQRSSSSRESRPLNLDPGYMSEDKLVLASTKNHSHRLYLVDGIYAEITLQFHRRRWQSCPWTYPDYRQEEYHEFFVACRGLLRERLHATG